MGEIRWTAAQRDAIEAKGCSIAVSAAAGSGKTAVLTQRIIERICDPNDMGDISRLLVVTFTKAAASELISRISEALSEQSAAYPENAHIRAQMLLLSSAHISTIHSFCLDLIRTNFQKCNLPPDFSAADETEIRLLMNRLMEELISDYFEGELLEGEEPIEDFGRFSDMFGDISHSEKLAETMLSLYDALSSTTDFLEKLVQFRKTAESAAKNGFNGSPWEICIREHLLRCFSHYRKIYEDAMHVAPEKPFKVISAEKEAIDRVYDFAENGGSYEKLSALLKNISFSRLTGVSSDPFLSQFSDFRKDFKEDLKELIEKYYSYSEKSLTVCFEKTAEAMGMLEKFLCSFDKRFAEEKRRRKWITFGDMERLALHLLYDREKDAPTELALSLRGAYDEIYIDEYQDTNEIQDKIFSLISKEDNRFNVGDIKQSIYGFRGAKPDIFSSLLKGRPKYQKNKEEKAVKIFLSENFRSSSQILQFCNSIFEKLMNAEEMRYGEDERLYCGSGKQTVLPEIYLLPKQKDAETDEPAIEEADFVAERIEMLLKNEKKADGTAIKPSDIAILLRSTASGAVLFETALKKRGIPCKNDSVRKFFENAEVLLMLSLLSVIDNPTREIPLAAALKSPLYGVTLDELLFIRRYQKEGTLFDALRHFTEENHFQKGEKFLRDYEKYALLASEMPCDALIWQIYTDTGIFSLIAGDETRSVYELEQSNANLLTFYNYARGFESGGFKGLSGFISFINEVLANQTKLDISGFSSPGDVVNIMTIHKSKGLEFPVCFLSGLGKRINFKESKEKTIYHERLGISVKIPEREGLVRLDTPLRTASLLDMKKEMIEEELRVLYVALTRAKERLFLTATVTEKSLEDGDYDLESYAGKYAMKSQYFSPYALYASSSYLDLLMTAAAENPTLFDLHTVSQNKESEKCENEEESPQTEAVPEDMPYYAAKKLVSEKLDYVYPYRKLSEIPSKLAVSKLYPNVLDETDDDVLSEEIPAFVPMPNFLMKEPVEAVTAAQRGTAMHTFMQFCDFENVQKNGVQAEVQRLAEKRFIFESDAEKMDTEKLSAFFQSRLAQEIMQSKRVFREKRFMIKLNSSLFSEEENEILKQEKLLVQGVIDCAFFDEKGELILVDYKTDFFHEGTPRGYILKTLRERHQRQLSYYKMACKQLFGVEPAHTYIYSFALNGTVEI